MITNEELAAWLAGEADPAVASQVESALPDDPALGARIDRIRAADSLVAAMPSSPSPSDAAVLRITAAAMRAAGDQLDLEAARQARTSEVAARVNRGSRLGGAMGRAGSATSGRRESQSAAYAGSSDKAGWLSRIDLSGWPVRLVAAFVVVALVGVGFGAERLGNEGERQDLGTVAADEPVDQAEAEVLPPEGDSDASGEGGSDEFTAATEAAAATAPQGGPENAPADASGNAPVEESLEEGLAQGQTDDGAEAATDQPLSALRPLDFRLSDDEWSEVVAEGEPTILSTPAGDVALLTIGKRFELLVTASEIDAQGRDKTDDAYRSPSLQMSSTTVQQWIDDVTPTATTIDSSALDTTDDVRTGPELARDCVVRRSLAVADVVPGAPHVVVVLTGVGQGNAGRLHALIDADGGIVVVDAVTCDPA